MAASRCWDCNTTFYTNYGGLYCNVCHQARKTRQHNENQAQQDRFETERIQRENARIQAQQTQALVDVENQRIAAINRQTQAIIESSTTTDQAKKRGGEYFDYEWNSQNAANLNITIVEDGSHVNWTYKHIYESDRLKNSFTRGLTDSVNKAITYNASTARKALKQSAYQIGYLHTQGSHLYFVLNPSVEIKGKEIYTKSYRSDFTTMIDEKDGTLSASWSNHFENTDLNESYKKGVETGLDLINTEEAKAERLKTEVPKIKKVRRQESWYKNKIKFTDFVFTILCISITFFSFIFILGLTSGWWAILSIIIPIGVWIQLREYQDEWRAGNRWFLDN